MAQQQQREQPNNASNVMQVEEQPSMQKVKEQLTTKRTETELTDQEKKEREALEPNKKKQRLNDQIDKVETDTENKLKETASLYNAQAQVLREDQTNKRPNAMDVENKMQQADQRIADAQQQQQQVHTSTFAVAVPRELQHIDPEVLRQRHEAAQQQGLNEFDQTLAEINGILENKETDYTYMFPNVDSEIRQTRTVLQHRIALVQNDLHTYHDNETFLGIQETTRIKEAETRLIKLKKQIEDLELRKKKCS